MKKFKTVQIAGVAFVFVALWFGYFYFQEQSLLSSGKRNAVTIIERIEERDSAALKVELAEFYNVDPVDVNKVESLRLAGVSIDYVESLVASGEQLEFIDHFIESRDLDTVYRAIFELPATGGSQDYAVIIFSRSDTVDEWRFANFALSATNPIETQ